MSYQGTKFFKLVTLQYFRQLLELSKSCSSSHAQTHKPSLKSYFIFWNYKFQAFGDVAYVKLYNTAGSAKKCVI